MKSSLNSFETLYKLHYPSMYAVAMKILRNPSDAEDAVQNAFEKMLRSSTRFPHADAEHARALSLRIARQAAIDLYRGQQRRSTVAWCEHAQTDYRVDVQQEIEQKQSLAQELHQLSMNTREAMILYGYYGYSMREVALRLQLPLETVKKRIQRARRTRSV